MNLLICMFICGEQSWGGHRNMDACPPKKGGRKGIVSEAGRLENKNTTFVFLFCGEQIQGVGGMGLCTEVGKRFVLKEGRPMHVCAEGVTPTYLKCGGWLQLLGLSLQKGSVGQGMS